MSVLSSILAVAKTALPSIPAAIGVGETIIKDVGLGSNPVVVAGEAAVTGIEGFLASAVGQEVEAWFEALVEHTVTSGAAVTVVPKAS